MTRNKAVFTYNGDEPTVDHAGDLVLDRALDILERQLDVQLKQLDIIRNSLTTRIFLHEGTCIRPVDPPAPRYEPEECVICKRLILAKEQGESNVNGYAVHKTCNIGVTPEKLQGLLAAIDANRPCYHCGFTLDRNSVADWYGYRHRTCTEHIK